MSLSDDELQGARVRFAPSPTGKLHLGSGRTALFNWLVARGSGGAFVLRLEDTDRERSNADFELDIMDSMRWMGLDWDEGPDIGGPHGPYRQSERMEIYRERGEKLLAEGKAYKCWCSAAELDERKKAVVAGGKAWRYDRKCADLPAEELARLEAEGAPYTVRFRVPAGTVTVDDMLRGDVNVDASEIDDFIIMRSDGTAGFHLAVVVDDITMEITHVIRGDDHLTNAVRHVLLFQALGADTPRFLHHSLLFGPDGTKLSKRHGSTSVSDYIEQGYLPEALVNYLALLSWSPGAGDEREIFTRAQLIDEFSIKGVSASKAIFDLDKLNWIDRQHIKTKSEEELTDLVEPFLVETGRGELLELPRDRLRIAVAAVRNSLERLTDGLEQMDTFVRPAGLLDEKASKELAKSAELNEALEICVRVLRSEQSSDREAAERIVETMRAEAKERGWGAKKVLWPFRLAVTGLTIGPDLLYLIMFWGPSGCAERIETTASTLEGTRE
ncbi:MAG TPA: glutamate--tRNA ligase [Candidatus Anoxymicrobiaceae bacterium]|jgi:nondiscriminating glutamyl-tRNA synthetase